MSILGNAGKIAVCTRLLKFDERNKEQGLLTQGEFLDDRQRLILLLEEIQKELEAAESGY